MPGPVCVLPTGESCSSVPCHNQMGRRSASPHRPPPHSAALPIQSCGSQACSPSARAFEVPACCACDFRRWDLQRCLEVAGRPPLVRHRTARAVPFPSCEEIRVSRLRQTVCQVLRYGRIFPERGPIANRAASCLLQEAALRGPRLGGCERTGTLLMNWSILRAGSPGTVFLEVLAPRKRRARW